jgi:hypothetical protein
MASAAAMDPVLSLFELPTSEEVSTALFPSTRLEKDGLFKRRTANYVHSLNVIYNKDEFTLEDLNKFNSELKLLINHINGDDPLTGLPYKHYQSICFFEGVGPSYACGCKQQSLSIKTIKALQIFFNTFIFFYDKVKTKNKELIDSTSINSISESLYNVIKTIIYFAGRKYCGNYLCETFTSFIESTNNIFKYFLDGRPLIIQTGTSGHYTCGRGVLWGQYKNGDGTLYDAIFLHRTISENNDSVNESVIGNPPTIGGRSRRRMQKKKRRTHKRK